MLADQSDRLLGIRCTARDRQVLGMRQRRVDREHRTAGPLDQARPHGSHEDQRRVLQMPYLEQLSNHHRFQHRADAARGDEKGVRSEHKLVQPRKEGPMLERLGHKRIDVLFKG